MPEFDRNTKNQARNRTRKVFQLDRNPPPEATPKLQSKSICKKSSLGKFRPSPQAKHAVIKRKINQSCQKSHCDDKKIPLSEEKGILKSKCSRSSRLLEETVLDFEAENQSRIKLVNTLSACLKFYKPHFVCKLESKLAFLKI